MTTDTASPIETLERLEKEITLLREALGGMLKHSCVADADPNDKDEEDHAYERAARAALQPQGDAKP